MRIFLTGGTGFVGSHFIMAASRRGHQISALRRPGSHSRIPLAKEPLWVDGDLQSFPKKSMANCDVFVHLAAHSANVPYDTLENCVHWNTVASLNCARAAFEAGVRRFLFGGSCFEYGLSANNYDRIPPNAPLLPVGSYPTSKAMASLCFREFIHETKSAGLIARMFHVYGEGEAETRFWPSLRSAALAGQDFLMSSGDQVRDFVHVSKAAEMLLALSERLNSQREYNIAEVNVGLGTAMRLSEFANEWWLQLNARGKLVRSAVPHRGDELMRIVPEIDSTIVAP
jgi:UDP-glucose 4-epimerase